MRQAREQRRAAAASKTEKLCTKCDRTLSLTEFRRDRARVDGLYPWCRECYRAYTGGSARRVAVQTKAEYDREYRRRNADRQRDEWFGQYLWSTYRLTVEQYDRMLAKQGGACAICGTTDAGAARGRSNGRFAVDHDHACCPGRNSCGGCVRGLLCRSCNFGIGALRDDIGIMRSAIAYLERADIPVETEESAPTA